MNEINYDSKTAKDRKNPLTEVDAPLRDQVPQKLLKKLNKMKMGPKVVKYWQLGNANRQQWLDKQQEFLGDWDDFRESTAEGPWQGSSSLHIPMPLIVAKALHARFLQALLDLDPMFQVKARTEAVMPRTEMVQDLMGYTLKKWINHRRGIAAVADDWVWHFVTAGCGIMKARWETKYLRYMDVVKETRQLAPEFGRDPFGNQIVNPKFTTEEVEKPVTKKVFDGPCADFRFPEDVLIVGGNGDPQIADSVTEFVPLVASDLWQLADQKIFDGDVVQEIIAGGPDSQSTYANSAIKLQRSQNAGNAQLTPPSELDRYHILEDYRAVDVDGSGINSEVVMWVHAKTGKILRATYLHRINKAGERPYFKIDFHRRSGQPYGIGIIEMLHPLSVELDAQHNMRVDWGMLSTMPFGFYRPTSSINPTTIQLEPGALIPTDNPTEDIYFPNLGNRTSFGFQEEQAIQTMIERLTGINDLSMGVLTGAQGATRTAEGTRALLGESNSNLNVHLRRMNTGWEQFLTYLLHLLQQRVPPGFEFRITGQDGSDYFRKVRDSEEIGGDFDFEVCANSATSNPSIQQQNAQQVLQMVSNPLYIQTGAVNVGNIYEGIRNFLKSMGIKDWARFCTKPPDHQYVLSPEEEANAILRGVDVPVIPQMDHQGFITYFQEIHDNDELLGQFSKESAMMLKAQAVKHQKMLEALKHAQAQAAQNAQQGANSTSGGMSPMASAAGPQAGPGMGMAPPQPQPGGGQ